MHLPLCCGFVTASTLASALRLSASRAAAPSRSASSCAAVWSATSAWPAARSAARRGSRVLSSLSELGPESDPLPRCSTCLHLALRLTEQGRRTKAPHILAPTRQCVRKEVRLHLQANASGLHDARRERLASRRSASRTWRHQLSSRNPARGSSYYPAPALHYPAHGSSHYYDAPASHYDAPASCYPVPPASQYPAPAASQYPAQVNSREPHYHAQGSSRNLAVHEQASREEEARQAACKRALRQQEAQQADRDMAIRKHALPEQ